MYGEHLERLRKAIAMEKTDRPPIVLNAAAFCCKYGGGKLADLVSRVEYGHACIIKGMLRLGDGEVDATELNNEYPPVLGSIFLSRIRVPGRDLPDDEIWQIDEQGLMTEEDYDTIIRHGWGSFLADYYRSRLDGVEREYEHLARHADKLAQMYTDAGIVTLAPIMALPPFGAISGGRGIPRFMRDLHRIPDKVQAVFDVIQHETVETMRQQIRDSRPLAVFIGGAREAGDFLTYKMFDRFAWPYFKELVEAAVAEGAFAYLHLDMCWDRFLDYFKELPKGKCIFSPDGTTDIFKAGQVLKGHMCFMGDVPASMLTLGTPDEVYAYSLRLIEEFADYGLIMSSGCSVPHNAKPENVRAMIAAALGK
jgi:hypothetical protein